MSYYAGLDLGSTAIKVVIVEGESLVWHAAVPTAPGQEALALGLLDKGLQELGITREQLKGIAATGYGKKLVQCADRIIDEVSANALGMSKQTEGEARVIINIGGQDIKIINIDEDGHLIDFKMNDKCAAGTGRFFEMAARIMDTSIYEFAELAAKAPKAATINSTCVVFAESEIVSLLAKSVPKEAIIKGLHESISRRISGMMDTEVTEGIYLDGGSANNEGLVEALEDELLADINVLELPQFTVAYGAACSLQQ